MAPPNTTTFDDKIGTVNQNTGEPMDSPPTQNVKSHSKSTGDKGRLVADVNATNFNSPEVYIQGKKYYVIAKALKDVDSNKEHWLSFQTGDEITNLKRVRPTVWEGIHVATEKQGLFHHDHVEILYDPVLEGFELITQKVYAYASSFTWNYCSKFLTAMLLVVAGLVFRYLGSTDPKSCDGRETMKMTELQSVFPSQDHNTWSMLRAGLLSSKTEGVQTFLFLHNHSSTAECFIRKLSRNCCVLRRAIDIADSEAFVSKIRGDLEDRKCMVIYDLEKMSPDGALVLKGLCDAYAPVVQNSKFYFAFNAGPQINEKNERQLARHLLETMWTEQHIEYDQFAGTLTRLIQNVLKLREEENFPC